jgi:hypothetical protein
LFAGDESFSFVSFHQIIHWRGVFVRINTKANDNGHVCFAHEQLELIACSFFDCHVYADDITRAQILQ